MSNRLIKADIVAKVSAEFTLAPGETIEDFKNRDVDIYIHGPGEKGYEDKFDLGADSVEITPIGT